MAKARELILAAQRPLHIDDILRGAGKDVTKKTRASVGGAMGNYVRKGEIFARTGPNTFGLLELEHHQEDPIDEEPPAGFGSLSQKREVGR